MTDTLTTARASHVSVTPAGTCQSCGAYGIGLSNPCSNPISPMRAEVPEREATALLRVIRTLPFSAAVNTSFRTYAELANVLDELGAATASYVAKAERQAEELRKLQSDRDALRRLLGTQA